MPKQNFYAVRNGHRPGIYTTWDDCLRETKGFPNAIFKKFPTRGEADAFVKAPISEGYGPAKSKKRPAVVEEDASPSSESNPYDPYSAFASSSSSSAPKRPRIDASYKDSIAKPPTAPPTRGVAAAAAYAEKPLVKPALTLQPTQLGKDGFTRLYNGRIVVFTDGSSLGNGKKGATAGAGVFWGDGHLKNLAVRVPGEGQTNNRGELLAIAIALENAPQDGCPLEIRSDSKYSISALTEWLRGWRRSGFRSSSGKDVLNKDLIQHIAILLDIRRSGISSSVDPALSPAHTYDADSDSDIETRPGPASKKWKWDGKRCIGAVRFKWVRAHEGTHGNEMADALANEGARKPASTLVPTYLTPADFTTSLKNGHPPTFDGLNFSFNNSSLPPPHSAPLSGASPSRRRDSSHSEFEGSPDYAREIETSYEDWEIPPCPLLQPFVESEDEETGQAWKDRREAEKVQRRR